jgi:glucosamine--fructose-6-phosphate aminotransferase (isomerizing)
MWSTRAITGISWRRKSTSSRKSFRTTLSNYIDFAEGKVRLDTGQLDFANLDRLAMSACGTAYYAGLVGKYWFERFAGCRSEIDVASEFRYREMPPLRPDGGAVHLPVRRDRRHTGGPALLPENGLLTTATGGQCRDQRPLRGNPMPCSPLLRGPEIGVASTKAFTCAAVVLLLLAMIAGRARHGFDQPKIRGGAGGRRWSRGAAAVQ